MVDKKSRLGRFGRSPEPTPGPLPDEALAELREQASTAARGGYTSDADIVVALLELIEDEPKTNALFADDPDGVEAQIRGLVADAVAGIERELAALTAPSDPERLAAAFVALEAEGILARQDVGWDAGELRDEMWSTLDATPAARGWTGFHRQDLERVVETGVLYLAYAHRSDRDDDFVVIAGEVAHRLRSAGFEVVWDGTAEQRIALQRVRWLRRFR